MKYCPKCQRVFEDEVLYCLEDGSLLHPKPDLTEKPSPGEKKKLDLRAMELFSMNLCPKCNASDNWQTLGDEHTCLSCGEKFILHDGDLRSIPGKLPYEKERILYESSPLFSMVGKIFGRSFKNPEESNGWKDRSKFGKLLLLGSYLLFAYTVEMNVGLSGTILAGILAFYFLLSPKNTETPRVWIGAVIAFFLFAYAGPQVFNVSKLKERLNSVRGHTESNAFEEVSDGSARDLTGVTEMWLLTFPFDSLGKISPEIQNSGLTEPMMNAAIETVLDEVGITIVPTAQTDMIVHLWVSSEPDTLGRFGYALNLELTVPPHVNEQFILWRKEFQGTVRKENLQERTIKELHLILDQFIDDYSRANPR